MSAGTNAFLGGLVTMCFVVVGVFFLKFWTRTRDFLFIAFGIAFWLMAANQGLVALAIVPREEQSWVYLLRVAAFVFIAIAIVRKNASNAIRRDGRSPGK
jgi:TRAP-type C4-dicarboxylate transport system permease small subunit